MITRQQYLSSLKVVKAYKLQCDIDIKKIDSILGFKELNSLSLVSEFIGVHLARSISSVLKKNKPTSWDASTMTFYDLKGVNRVELLKCRLFGKKSLIKLLMYMDELDIEYI